MDKLLLWLLLLLFVTVLVKLASEAEWYLLGSLIVGLLTQREGLKKLWDERKEETDE